MPHWAVPSGGLSISWAGALERELRAARPEPHSGIIHAPGATEFLRLDSDQANATSHFPMRRSPSLPNDTHPCPAVNFDSPEAKSRAAVAICHQFRIGAGDYGAATRDLSASLEEFSGNGWVEQRYEFNVSQPD